MAFKGKHISNPKTGQEITFLQTAGETGGRLLEMEATFNAHSKEPPAHYHPFQVEDFTILEGELSVRINGHIEVLTPGDTLHIPAKKVHSMWNGSAKKALVNWKVRPALDTEYFLETAIGLAQDNKTNENGAPGLLQAVLMVNRYSRVYRLASPPFFILKIIFLILTPFAYAMGYRPSYKKYLD
jgi:quercetin dioxygenase-like cupin family protein